MYDPVTIIIPISREDYLQYVFSALELLTCNRKLVNILAIVDGSDELFIKARNFVNTSKFNEALCVQYSKSKKPETGLLERRERIADIHNELKQYIGECKYIFGIEDDTIVPPLALQRLLQDYEENPHAGFIQGVELGRWGKTYVGAWRADDVYEPREIASIMPSEQEFEMIDCGGLFCFVTLRDRYMEHEFKTFENNGMGPDADYGMTLRTLGFSNYIDWRVKCIHMNGDEKISIATHKPVPVRFMKRTTRWQFYGK